MPQWLDAHEEASLDRHNSQPEQPDSDADRDSAARDHQNLRLVRPEADMPLSGWRITPASVAKWVMGWTPPGGIYVP